MIVLTNIQKTFETQSGTVHAVQDVNLHIQRGESYGIIGYSGAGKSTLVRCINLLEPPTSGTVTVDGQDLTAMSARQLYAARKKIGMIFQHFNLMPSRTVFENVAYPLKGSGLSKSEIAAKVKSLLELVNIAEKETAYPSQLSGGQKQRVAIARALANDPKVLLCDEATSALDPQTTGAILQLLKEVNKNLGITLVVITHEMAVIKELCDRVAVMEKGRVVEENDVFSIFADPQKPITQEFIQSTSNLHKIDRLIAEHSPVARMKQNEVILRLSYLTKNVSEPIISHISRQFNLDLNIILSDVQIVQNAPIGGTVVIVSGRREDIRQAVEYLIEKEVGVEVIADARVSE